MAKRKKRSKRNQPKEVGQKSNFWPLSGALLLMIFSLFVLLGGFGTGGPLPVNLFEGIYWALGWAAYFTPISLLLFGVWKFTSEDHEIPLNKFVSMLGLLVAMSSWVQLSFSSYDNASGAFSNGNGGSIGELAGKITLSALDKTPASLLFFVLLILAFFFVFNISPKVLLKLLGLFKRHEDDTDLAELKAKSQDSGFKLNEGVPVEHDYRRESTTKLGGLKKAAENLATVDNQDALTVASDPNWKFPDVSLLNQKQDKVYAGDIEGNANTIKETYANFGINVEMDGANVGPRVTQYTLKPPAGVKISKLGTHDRDLEYSLAAPSVRIEAPIPGKKLVGIEVPNQKPATVRLSSIFQSDEWKTAKSPLSIAIGKDISGQSIVQDLDEMPHMLVAGQTKAGKSVMINAILASLLYQNSPADLKLILIDPKHVELKPYDGIPHLLTPVITEPEKCISALKWTVAEMERRYRALSDASCRDVKEYNESKKEEGMPFIVVVIDELSDMMSAAPRDLEALIVRVAQKSRAVGIHLILATQSPRVNVVTGLIKANVPARIAFTVASDVDSRVILDLGGADKLLGMGDMLLKTYDIPRPKRVQGALIETAEVRKLTDFLREQRSPQYDEDVTSQPVQLNGRGGIVADYGANDVDDDMWKDAVAVVIDNQKASTSLLQRRLRIGYGRAARLIETMEEKGIIGPGSGSRPREVLVSSINEIDNDQQNEPDIYDEIPDDNV